MYKVSKNKKGCYWQVILETDDYEATISTPKCRCGSCPPLDIEIKNSDGERSYSLYPYNGNSQQEDDLAELVLLLSHELVQSKDLYFEGYKQGQQDYIMERDKRELRYNSKEFQEVSKESQEVSEILWGTTTKTRWN